MRNIVVVKVRPFFLVATFLRARQCIWWKRIKLFTEQALAEATKTDLTSEHSSSMVGSQ